MLTCEERKEKALVVLAAFAMNGRRLSVKGKDPVVRERQLDVSLR